MLDAQSVQHPGDPLSMLAPRVPFVAAAQAPRAPRRVGFSANLGLSNVDPEVAGLCGAAARRFEGMGSIVDDAVPDFGQAIETFQTLRGLLFAAIRGDLLATERARINPSIIWNIDKGLGLTVDEILRAERDRARLFRSVVEYFEHHDLLLCPTVALPPYPVEQPYPTRIGDQVLTSYIDWMFLTFVVTLTGCPALSLPCGFTRAGLPIGLQIVGPPHGDAAVIAAAAALEQDLGIVGRVPIDPMQ